MTGFQRVAGAMARPLLRIDALSYRLWLGCTLLTGVALAAALPGHPFMSAGVVGGSLVLLMLLLRPVLLLGIVLAIGAVNLAFITGGEKQLLDGMGGLDMNGIRLMGLVAGLTGLTLLDRRMLDRALDGAGRWYLLFLVFAAGTLLASSSPVEGLRLLFKLAFPFLLFVAVRALTEREEDLERLGRWTLVAAVVMVFLVNPVLVLTGGYTVDDSGHLRIQGLGMHQSPFSQYLVAMAFLSLARYMFRGETRYLVLALALGGWIVVTLTRITLLASLVGLAVMALYASMLRRNVKPVLATGLMAAAVAVPLTPFVLERSLGFIPSPGELIALMRDPSALIGAMRWSGRDYLWPVLFGAFMSSPVIGMGLGSSGPVLRTSFSEHVTDIPHNEYLRLLVETGVVGLSLLLVGVTVIWVKVARAGLALRGVGREYAVAAVAFLPAAGVMAFTDNTIDYYTPVTQYMGFFCAAALAARRLERAETGNAALPDGATAVHTGAP